MYSTFPISLESFFPFFVGAVFLSIDSVYYSPVFKILEFEFEFSFSGTVFQIVFVMALPGLDSRR